MLRLIQVLITKEKEERLNALINEASVIQQWSVNADNDKQLCSVLHDTENTESITDLLVKEFQHTEGFRLILLPIEATWPTAPTELPGDESSIKQNTKVAQRISREELYEDIIHASVLSPLYIIMVTLSTIVAAIGLVRGDVAIIIGAMVIAPLLGPNIGLSLACTLGDAKLAKQSLSSSLAGACLAGIFSCTLGFLLTFDPFATELISRTEPKITDIILALAAGAAGTLAFTSGVSSVVVGVMVAVALLPPLVVAGLYVGSGHYALGFSALTLVMINVTCINLAAILTFYLKKVRPRTWWEAKKAVKTARMALAIWMGLLIILTCIILFNKDALT